jgi:hypothetical protein
LARILRLPVDACAIAALVVTDCVTLKFKTGADPSALHTDPSSMIMSTALVRDPVALGRMPVVVNQIVLPDRQ